MSIWILKRVVFCTFLLISLSRVFAIDQGDLIITEWMANPNDLPDNEGEYFELYNCSDEAIDIRGLFILDDGSDDHLIASDMPLVIGPGDFFVMGISDSPYIQADYVYSGITLSNGADEIVIFDGLNEVCRISYSDGDPFGAGVSCELNHISNHNNGVSLESDYIAGSEPIAEYTDLGSPGTKGNTEGINSSVIADRLVITSVNGNEKLQANSDFFVYISLYDSLDQPVLSSDTLHLFLEVIYGSGQLSGSVYDTIFPDEKGSLLYPLAYSAAGDSVLMEVSCTNQSGLISDTTQLLFFFGLPSLVITEIFYNPPVSMGPGEDFEFIEILNNSEYTVNMGGYFISDAIDFTFPDTCELTSGEIAIVSSSFQNYSHLACQAYEWAYGNLDNSGECICLFSPDSVLLDSVFYSNAAPWAVCPDGYGPSLELISADSSNEVSINWLSALYQGGSPGLKNAFAGPDSTSWTGQINAWWPVPSNWTNGVPGDSSVAIIDDSLANISQTFGSGRYSCKDLLIMPACGMHVTDSTELYVHHELVLNCDSSKRSFLRLGSGGNTVVGNTSHMYQYMDGGISRDPEGAIYHYISSPMENAFADLFPEDAFLRYYFEPQQKWINMSSDSSLLPGKAYSAWLSSDTVLHFDGVFNNGELIVDNLSFTSSAFSRNNADYEGFNLIGNPYPSSINWDDPSLLKTNIDDAIYFWNPDLQAYSSYVNGIGNNPATTDSIIPALQGFFVRVSQAGLSGSVKFNNACRINNMGVYRSSEENTLLRINAIGKIGKDQLTIRFLHESTEKFDENCDALKLSGANAIPDIYSLTSDRYKCSINTIPFSNSIEDVQISFVNDIIDVVDLQWEGIESIPADIPIILEDKMNGKYVDLRHNTSYSFSYTSPGEEMPFVLHLKETSVEDIHALPDIILFQNENSFTVESSKNNTILNIEAYDLAGRKVPFTIINNSANLVKFSISRRGFYVLVVEGRQTFQSFKVVLP